MPGLTGVPTQLSSLQGEQISGVIGLPTACTSATVSSSWIGGNDTVGGIFGVGALITVLSTVVDAACIMLSKSSVTNPLGPPGSPHAS